MNRAKNNLGSYRKEEKSQIIKKKKKGKGCEEVISINEHNHMF